MTILGIETSCDETAAAVIKGAEESATVLSSVIASQIDIHRQYGGVVPEVAAREHVLQILPVISRALKKAGLDNSLLPRKGLGLPGKASAKRRPLDAIAVATGPGLVTSLLIGAETAKALSYAWRIPLVCVNHIEAHIYANFINDERREMSGARFPSIILTVSGGHTLLVLMHGHGKMKVIGQTRDDAAGEAFDKAAQMLGLGYPGGPAIAQEAAKHDKSNIEDRRSKIALPRPMIDRDNFDFSFSGLKTALLYALKQDPDWPDRVPAYAREYQQAIIDVLIKKTLKAAKVHQAQTIMLTGGVAANQKLRQEMQEAIRTDRPGTGFAICDTRYTTDNAAMVASAGYFKAANKDFTPWQNIKVDCNLKI